MNKIKRIIRRSNSKLPDRDKNSLSDASVLFTCNIAKLKSFEILGLDTLGKVSETKFLKQVSETQVSSASLIKS